MQNRTLPKEPAYPIESVGNALKLILLLGEKKLVGLSEAAKELGIARSSAHRLFAMLQYYGFAKQDPATRGYVAGHVLMELGLSLVRSMDIRSVALPTMRWLSERVGETVYLGILEGSDVLIIESVESTSALRLASRTGMRLPGYGAALGRALLAELPDREILAQYRSGLPDRFRPDGMKTVKDLVKSLEETRRKGYAVNIGSPEHGVSAIGVPVRDVNGNARASLAVAAPTSRLRASDVPRTAPLVIEAATEIGEGLSALS